MNLAEMEKALDKTKITIFLGSTAALLGSVMCSLDIMFDSRQNVNQCPTTITDVGSKQEVSCRPHSSKVHPSA